MGTDYLGPAYQYVGQREHERLRASECPFMDFQPSGELGGLIFMFADFIESQALHLSHSSTQGAEGCY